MSRNLDIFTKPTEYFLCLGFLSFCKKQMILEIIKVIYELTLTLEDYISKIYEWLSPLSEEFRKKQLSTYNFRSRQDGTGNWLLATDEFTDWLSGRTKQLWCRGIRIDPLFVLKTLDILSKRF